VRLTGCIPQPILQGILTLFFRATLPARVANVIIPFRFNHDVFEQSLRLAGGVRYSETLQRYPKPVLLVNGKWDVLFRLDERIFARASHARVVIMPRTDHVAPLREPERFCAHVRAFARELFGVGCTTSEGRTA
jgi:pimeloyl-ACP methyl ester carboxylesterase